jgi:hypothetical protein
MQRRVALAFGVLVAAAASACASAVESSRIEDAARRAVPVPICLKPLPRHADKGVIAQLSAEDYWSMILPSYEPGAGTVDAQGRDCAGRALLSKAELAQAEGPHEGPIPARPQDVTVTGAADGFKVVWLRTHQFADGTAAGPLALVRPREAYAEVYAVGLYRGHPGAARLGFERLGFRILVTATNDGCGGGKAAESCQTNLTLFLCTGGELLPSAQFATLRVETGAEPGMDRVQYRLTANPIYEAKSVRVREQMVVRDSGQNELRKSNQDRIFTLQGGTALAAKNPSLWTQVVGTKKAAELPASHPPVDKRK